MTPLGSEDISPNLRRANEAAAAEPPQQRFIVTLKTKGMVEAASVQAAVEGLVIDQLGLDLVGLEVEEASEGPLVA